MGRYYIQNQNFETILCSARQTLCRVGGFKVKLASAVLKIEKRLHAMLLSYVLLPASCTKKVMLTSPVSTLYSGARIKVKA